MRQTPFCNRAVRFLSLACLLSAWALHSPDAFAQQPPPPAPPPKTAADVVREMRPPDPNPPRGSSARRAEASKKANENVEKAEQERQQASRDAANNPNDASKQAKDLEAQQKLDEAVTNRAKLDDEVREANDAYQNAYKEAETAANNMAADTPDKTLKLRDAKRRYDAALEAAKAKSARVLAPGWNRQRFAELMERQRQATQQGAPGTPQTQPGGATPGTGNIGQTQTPPTAAQVPKINVITDIAGGGEGYNGSGFQFGWSGSYGKGDWSIRGEYRYTDFQPSPRADAQTAVQPATGTVAQTAPDDDAPLGGPKVGPVEYVRVCTLYGAGFFYIPGTDTCIKLGSYVRADVCTGIGFEFQADNPNQYIGLRPREVIRLPVDGVEKNTELGFPYGTLRCFRAIDGGCTIPPVTPEQGTAYGLPDLVGNLSLDTAWGPSPVTGPAKVVFQVRSPNYQYGGSVANITGQSTFPPVQIPQGCQATAYDFPVGDQTFRQFGYRADRKLGLGLTIALKYINSNLATSYPGVEDDTGRNKEPALDIGTALASGHTEKLPQALLDLRPPPARMRARR
jgi:hypothetical protein